MISTDFFIDGHEYAQFGVPGYLALEALIKGCRVRHLNWHHSEWIVVNLDQPARVDAEGIWSHHNRKQAEKQGGSIMVHPTITKYTKAGMLIMGYQPTVLELLSENWVIIDNAGHEYITAEKAKIFLGC